MSNPLFPPDRSVVVEQKAIASNDLTTFTSSMQDCLGQGWRIVPGSVVIAIASPPSPANSYSRPEERYFAVVEK